MKSEVNGDDDAQGTLKKEPQDIGEDHLMGHCLQTAILPQAAAITHLMITLTTLTGQKLRLL